jgi:hypothetical protein
VAGVVKFEDSFFNSFEDGIVALQAAVIVVLAIDFHDGEVEWGGGGGSAGLPDGTCGRRWNVRSRDVGSETVGLAVIANHRTDNTIIT